mgnify:CR=1 FL=1
MNRFLKYFVLALLFAVLFLIRAFEKNVFYDPLVVYFQNDYLYAKMPDVNMCKLLVNMLYRYALNSIVTIAIIYVLFEKKELAQFTGVFLMIAFLLLIAVFVLFVRNEFKEGYLFPFYIRRFLIHPLFLLLLMPAFYYQKNK